MKMVNAKQVFADSLIRLAQEKEFSKITVQNIIDESHSSRRTFYNHFSDKYELMSWIYEEATNDILACFRITKNWQECVIDMYRLVEKEKDYYKSISMFTGQNSFIDFLYRYTKGFFIATIQESCGADALTGELRYAIDHHSYGIAYTVADWIQQGFKVSADTMAQWQYHSMPELLRQYMH